ncbi:MAG: lipocalin-like domain-containing protein [Flavisolibacter sp.]|nr:lipocalin-like domain-containing protein [Flavisolibacter sp.]
MDERNQFIGIWRLMKWTAKQVDGQVLYPYGEDAVGQILYDAKGNVMVEIMKQQRKLFASNDFLHGTAEEILSAYNGFIAYCGTYDIDLVAKRVIHHIKISSFPNWVGQDQIRYYDFQNGSLRLRAPAIGTAQHELIWQKIQ